MRCKRYPILSWSIMLCLVLLAGGCMAPISRPRLGALPYPGMLTLYDTADPQALGHHRSGGLFGPPETDRGIIYTTRAGFLDLAHLRATIDRTYYCYERIHEAIEDDAPTARFNGPDNSVYHLQFDYPPGWKRLPEAERKAITEQLALRLAQRTAYVMMTWHEVQTWYGYRSSMFDESASAFSYDDAMSHWVGMTVAGTAIQRLQKHPAASFDKAVTEALAPKLRELGAVPRDETHRAVLAVEGVWWKNDKPLVRHVDTALTTGFLRPMLVPGYQPPRGVVRPPAQPPVYPMPTLLSIRGRSFARFCRIEIETRWWDSHRISNTLAGEPKRFCPDRHLPQVLNNIAAAARAERAELASTVD